MANYGYRSIPHSNINTSGLIDTIGDITGAAIRGAGKVLTSDATRSMAKGALDFSKNAVQ